MSTRYILYAYVSGNHYQHKSYYHPASIAYPNYRRQRSRVKTFELQYMLRVRVSRIEAETFTLSKPRPLL
jgi:hypothetical protein